MAPSLEDLAGLSVVLGDTKTGTVLADISAVESLSCSDGLDPGTASLRCAVPVHHDDLAGIDIRTRTNPADSFIALVNAENVLWAGPIWGRRYAAQTGSLELSASGMMSILDRRWCSADPRANPVSEAADISLRGLTLRAIAARLVRIGMRSTTGDDGRLPIVFGDLENESGRNERQYFGYDLASIGERLGQLTEVINGPDLHFAPRWRSNQRDGIEWQLRAGAPALGQVGAPWVWESGNNLQDVSTDEDGGGMASLALAPGEGSEREKVIGRAIRTTLQDSGWPALFQAVTGHTSTKDQATADAYAAEYVRAKHLAVETWTATVDAFSYPAIGEWLVGDDCRVIVPDDPWLRGNDFVRRIIGWSYNGGTSVQLKLSATPGQVS